MDESAGGPGHLSPFLVALRGSRIRRCLRRLGIWRGALLGAGVQGGSRCWLSSCSCSPSSSTTGRWDRGLKAGGAHRPIGGRWPRLPDERAGGTELASRPDTGASACRMARGGAMLVVAEVVDAAVDAPADRAAEQEAHRAQPAGTEASVAHRAQPVA